MRACKRGRKGVVAVTLMNRSAQAPRGQEGSECCRHSHDGKHTNMQWRQPVSVIAGKEYMCQMDVQRVQQGIEFAESDRMKESEESKQEQTVSKRKTSFRRSGHGSSTEEDQWLGVCMENRAQKEGWNEMERDEQRAADEKKLIPESICDALTEESYQNKFKASQCVELHSNRNAHEH